MKVRPVIRVGIYAGKTAHHACAVDGDGKVVFSRKVTNDRSRELWTGVETSIGSEIRASVPSHGAAGYRVWPNPGAEL
ncbi:hypothetical protein AB0I53_24380 [Saccharopolyspora sp. NPDC050389]|uniref:IS110 family transposase n=1 Tax=Saccharopolyspora sp. NPDC050389 TaxID=3155516 RepID=UPI00340A0AFD